MSEATCSNRKHYHSFALAMPRRELIDVEQAKAHEMSIAGMTTRAIASHFEINPSTVVRVVACAESHANNNNPYKSDRHAALRKTTQKQDEKLQRQTCKDYQERRRPLAELHHNLIP